MICLDLERFLRCFFFMLLFKPRYREMSVELSFCSSACDKTLHEDENVFHIGNDEKKICANSLGIIV